MASADEIFAGKHWAPRTSGDGGLSMSSELVIATPMELIPSRSPDPSRADEAGTATGDGGVS